MSSHVCLCVYWCICRAADELQNEARSHVLNHKNIVGLFAITFERGHYGIVLEFVPDGCLEDFIHKHQVLNYVNYITSYVHMCNTQFQLLVHFATQLIRLVWSVLYLLNKLVVLWQSVSESLDVMLLLCTQTIGIEVREAMVPKVSTGGDTNVDIRSATSTQHLCYVYTGVFGCRACIPNSAVDPLTQTTLYL